MPRKGSKKYKDSDFNGIIEDISTTTGGIIAICKKHGMDVKTFYRYMEESEALHQSYARAKRKQAGVLFDEMIIRAKNVKAEKNEIQKERLVIDTMKWVLGKLRPEKYGDMVTVNIDVDAQIKQLCATLNLPESEFRRVSAKLDSGQLDFSEVKVIGGKDDTE